MAMVQREAEFGARLKGGLVATGAVAEANGRRARPWEGKRAQRVAAKWSARKTLAFIIVVCGAFWATVIAYLLS
jgi:hypothetical protein